MLQGLSRALRQPLPVWRLCNISACMQYGVSVCLYSEVGLTCPAGFSAGLPCSDTRGCCWNLQRLGVLSGLALPVHVTVLCRTCTLANGVPRLSHSLQSEVLHAHPHER